jgi:hypothetical protein
METINLKVDVILGVLADGFGSRGSIHGASTVIGPMSTVN